MYYGFIGIIAVVAVIFVLNLFHVFNIFSCNPFANQAQVRFYDEIEPVNEEDSVRLRELLYGKPLHYDSPSCGFGEDVSVSFGGDTFMPARDGDDIVENNGKYLTLTFLRSGFCFSSSNGFPQKKRAIFQ